MFDWTPNDLRLKVLLMWSVGKLQLYGICCLSKVVEA